MRVDDYEAYRQYTEWQEERALEQYMAELEYIAYINQQLQMLAEEQSDKVIEQVVAGTLIHDNDEIQKLAEEQSKEIAEVYIQEC